MKTGVFFSTPVFDGASEQEIRDMLQLAFPEEVAKTKGLTDLAKAQLDRAATAGFDLGTELLQRNSQLL